MHFLLFLLLAQTTPDLTIGPKDASTSGNLCFQGTNGNKVCLSVANPVTAHNLTWPGAASPGCLTVDGSNVLSWAACVSLPISDNSDLLQDNVNTTARARFELSAVTPGVTRVATWPDANFTMAGINIQQTFTQNQTFAANILFSGLRDVGTPTDPASNVYFNQARVPSGPCFKAGMALSGVSGLVYAQDSACNTTGELTGSGVNVANSGRYSVGGTTVIDASRRLTLDGAIPNVGSGLIPMTGSLSLGTTSNPWLGVTAISGSVDQIASSIAGAGTSRVGAPTLPYNHGYFTNMTVTGTCTGCGSIPDASTTVSGKVNTGTQSFAGNKSFQGSLFPTFSNVYDFGSLSLQWNRIVAGTGQFTVAVDAPQASFNSLSVPGTITIGTIQGVFSGTGSIGTSVSNIGAGFFTNLTTSAFGSSTIRIGGGNLVNRTVFGSPSCSLQPDGQQVIDTFNLRVWVCIGGIARYAQLF
jgi:hypothetical protein